MAELGRMLILLGAVLITTGLVILGIQKLPFSGKLPGDILIKKEHFTFYFPLATGIIISILISLILYLIGKFR
ncbi:MAG: hypothetical protein A2X58_14590 [Nitrospirae bacterium GWC2_56_14]|nr:MAG: hypothetical protein A2X58_14590 [Nitrospirae bacterium GWC2_56_14]